MRVLVLIKGNEDSERGVIPRREELLKMGEFCEELVKAGVILAEGGLHPTSRSKRVNFDGAKPTVIDGPFPETKELVAGFWIWKVKSMDEAVEWLKRAPFERGDVEIRPMFEAEDFGAELAPEVKAYNQRMREKIAANQ